jgi:hypothetical protein
MPGPPRAVNCSGGVGLGHDCAMDFNTSRNLTTDRYEDEVSLIRARLEAPLSVSESSESKAEAEGAYEHAVLMREYHARSLAQSQLSFQFALGAAVAGFLVILLAIATVAFGGFEKAGIAGIQLVAATIVEAVAGLFFALSNRSRALLTEFFDKLREDRQLDESLRLARDLPLSSPVRDGLHAALAMQFAHADRSLVDAVLHSALPVARNIDPRAGLDPSTN